MDSCNQCAERVQEFTLQMRKLTDENHRLREALEDVEMAPRIVSGDAPEICRKMGDLARAALTRHA
jgi:hypothetical protein